MEAGEVAVKIENLTKYYGQEKILDSITLTVKQGEAVGIAGPNGAGKSTLLRIIAGLEPPTQGKVIVRGRVGYVPQEVILLPWRTLRGNILLAAKLRKIPRHRAEEVIRWGARLLGLEEYLNKRPYQVSGGTRRKTQILMALATDPEILLLDEPFTGLDRDTITALQKAIDRMRRSENLTIIIVSHMIDEILPIVDKLYILTHKPARIKEILE
ncbi:MAG: ATP-binding cassette domain-containing protein [Desulfurococcales archaeon]|nr:ATP-binding cassette domain-containing protein [Desulfurococcales archaeon]